MSIITQVQELVDRGNYETAQQQIDQYNEQDLEIKAHLLVFKIRIHRHLGKFDEALEVAKEIYHHNLKLNSKHIKIKTIIEEAYVYWNMSSFEQTSKLIEKGKSVYVSEDQDIIEAEAEISTLDNLQGLVQLYAGDLNEALKCFKLGLERRIRIGQRHMTAISLNNIGVCYYRRGEPDKSKKYFNDSVEIFRQISNSTDIVLPFSNLALVYYDLGKLNESLEYFKQSVNIELELGNPINIAETYFGMTRIYLKLNKIDKVDMYITKLKELDEIHDFQLISQWYRLAESKDLMNKLRISEKIRAQELLSQIVQEPILHQRLTIMAMKELCNFYLMELQLYGSEGALDDAVKLANDLYDTAQDQSSFSLLVEVLMLNAKLALIQGDYSSALLQLDQAEFTAVENGLIGLEIQITMERVALEAETEKWRQLSKENASLKEKIDQSRIVEYLQDIRGVVDKY
ncbi:MAG: tetratricopeptide repeat protein [Candidatus Heimdallarchaeota archaeon]|nr:tetratricopeptide repeat protein [Candidatus Heimdallarchaeota archaeon]